MINKLLSAQQASGVVAPEGVSFDGSTDYLSRASDLVGNADGKTFTFSAFIYSDYVGNLWIYRSDNAGSNGVEFRVVGGNLQFYAKNSANAFVLDCTYSNFGLTSKNTSAHILLSIDLTNVSNRKLYINDKDVTSSVTWSTYTNDNIDFTVPNHLINRQSSTSAVYYRQRLSNVFLAREYIDLSIESNRRIFITADGKPA